MCISFFSKKVLNSIPEINSNDLVLAYSRASGIPSMVSWSVIAIAASPVSIAVSISCDGVSVPSE